MQVLKGAFDAFMGKEIDYTIELVRKSIGRLRDLSPLWEMYKQGVDLNSIEWAHH